MLLFGIVVLAVSALGLLAGWMWRRRERLVLERHSVEPEELRAWVDSDRRVLIFDIRQPLDLLAHSEIIPGAVRIPPQELLDDPSRIPRDEDLVVYCTCAADRTSLSVVRRALEAKFTRVKLLKGGLEAWKAKGYPVEPYVQAFHLDTAR